MYSIPKTAAFRLTESGIIVSGQTITNSGGFAPGDRWEREKGDITGLSSASRLRLRKLLASSRPVDGNLQPWGCCLTIPGEVLSQDVARGIWYDWINNYATKKYKMYPQIWRVELQRRRQAHWHVLIWLPKQTVSLALLRVSFADDWRRLVRKKLSKDGSMPWSEKTDYGFETFGVRFKRLKSVGEGSANYLAPELDHESKRKQEQHGWIGRQWGVLNRQRLIIGEETEHNTVRLAGSIVGQIIGDFKTIQERRRASGRGYVGAGVGKHWRLPSVLFGRDADVLERVVRDRLAMTNSKEKQA